MDEAIKNRIVIILAVLATIFFFSTLSSCNNATRQKAARDKEMAARLALEEKTSKYVQERSALEEKTKAKEKEVQELKSALATVQKSLVQEQLVSQSLKEELEKATKLKDIPEKSSGQVLTDGKKSKK
jgi:type II secretory pathway pseudopilin PulG